MRTKRFFGLVAVLALLVLASLAGFTPAARAASNIVVCPSSPCPASEIQAAIEAASDGDTILIFPGTYSGGITVDKSVTLVDAGPSPGSVVLSGGSPVVTIDNGVTASIRGVTITGGGTGVLNYGTLTVIGSTISGNSAQNSDFIIGNNLGGGIFNRDGAVTVSNSTVSDNKASSGGGIFNYGGALTVENSSILDNSANANGGGGIVSSDDHIASNPATLTVRNSTISGNTASGTYGDGGGILNEGTAAVSASTLSGNAANSGGAIENVSSTLTVTSSAISGNTARDGGGIYNTMYANNPIPATVTVSNSTISGNTASKNNFGTGGGIRNESALTVSGSTLSGNSADGLGGGIYSTDFTVNPTGVAATVTVSDSTISRNRAFDGGGIYSNAIYIPNVSPLTLASTVTVSATIIAKNSVLSNDPDCVGTLTDGGYNLLGNNGIDSAICPGLTNGQNGNQVGTPTNPIDPVLSPLQDNGGPTWTQALWQSSPAIDAIPVSSKLCPPTDQRGKVRPDNGESSCDIGAYEYQDGAVFTTTAALGSSANPSVSGQAVTYTATVSPVPDGGTVAFTYNSGYGNSAISGCDAVAVDTSSGTATCSLTYTDTGSYAVTAAYSGDGSYSGSTSNTITQTVNQAATTTSLSSSANPSVSDQPVTFTAAVVVNKPGSGLTPGTVSFADNGATIAGCNLVNVDTRSDTATCTTSALSVGSYTITATYSGYHDLAGSTSNTVAQTVNQVSTATSLSSSANPSVSGQAVTYTATVEPAPDGGTVAFADGASGIPGCGAVAVDAASGAATCSVTYAGVGSHSVTATYNGDGSYTGSTSTTVAQTVYQAATTTSLSSSQNPATFGASVTFTATVAVNKPGAGSPGGTVTFADNGTAIAGCGNQPVANGQATCTTAALAAGSHSVTATYNGDSDFSASTSTTVAQTVNQAATATGLGSSANPSAVGHQVTYTATVSPAPDGGTVAFADNGAAIAGCGGRGVDASGRATCAVTYASTGAHQITATYSGDGNYKGSTSNTLTQQVDTDLSGYPTTPSGSYNLSGVNLSSAYLVGANLQGANLSSANLSGANLSGANLSGARLAQSSVKGATLVGANLHGADLTGSNFTGANLSNADLSGANLTLATFKGATGMNTANLTGVTWSQTKCPDGTTSDQDGGSCRVASTP